MTDEASQYTTTPLTKWSVQMLPSVLISSVKLKLAFGQAIKQFYSECGLSISCYLRKFNILTDVLMVWASHVQVSYTTVSLCMYNHVTLYAIAHVTVSLCVCYCICNRVTLCAIACVTVSLCVLLHV